MLRNIIMVTTDKIPMPHIIENYWSMIEFTAQIEISKKGLIRKLIEGEKNEHEIAYSSFLESMPKEANGVIGVKVSTSAQQFNNGTFLYITYIGTPIKYKLV
ncbi:MAG: hypothetical protein ACYDB5_10710 [bacterium]